jgi:hypothetical protein
VALLHAHSGLLSCSRACVFPSHAGRGHRVGRPSTQHLSRTAALGSALGGIQGEKQKTSVAPKAQTAVEGEGRRARMNG